MDIEEIRTLPDDELTSEMEKARAKVFKMRFQGKGEDVENPGSLKTLRRHIARMLTVRRERELNRSRAASAGSRAASGNEKA